MPKQEVKAVIEAPLIQKMRVFSIASINALVKHGGVASLKDTAAQAEVKAKIIALRTILVGRPFPPMLEHLRVSIGTPEEMDRFMVAFKQIFPAKSQTSVAQ